MDTCECQPQVQSCKLSRIACENHAFRNILTLTSTDANFSRINCTSELVKGVAIKTTALYNGPHAFLIVWHRRPFPFQKVAMQPSRSSESDSDSESHDESVREFPRGKSLKRNMTGPGNSYTKMFRGAAISNSKYRAIWPVHSLNR